MQDRPLPQALDDRDATPRRPGFPARIVAVLGRPLFWIVLGLALKLPGMDSAPASRFHGIDWLLYAGLLAGLVAQGKGWAGVTLSPRAAAIAFVVLVWAFGMIYEMSLSVDGTGVGGMHPDTFTSFVLAQGDYLLLALLCLAAVRLLHLGFTGLFWFAAGIALTEGLVFTGVLWQVVLSPAPWAAPAFLAYYFLAYAAFLTLPLMILNPAPLWSARARRLPAGRIGLIVAGFLCGFASRLIWALGYGPAAHALFDLAPPVE